MPLTYAKPMVAKPGFSFDNPGSLWTRADEPSRVREERQQGASAKLTVRLNDTTTVTSLTAYRESNYRFFIDADATELAVQTSDVPDVQRQVSQELTLVQRRPTLTWIGGAFFFDEHDDGRVESRCIGRAGSDPAFREGRRRAWALFGQATSRCRAACRSRAASGTRTSGRTSTTPAGCTGWERPSSPIPASFYDFVDRATYDAWTPKGSLQVQASRDTFVYVSATRGFKSGGFNPTAPEPGGGFRPEFAWSYEGGVKRTMAGGRVRVNTAAFYNDYQDLQVQTFLRPACSTSATRRRRRSRASRSRRRGTVGAACSSRGTCRGSTRPTTAIWRSGRAGRRDAAGHRLNNAPEWSGSGSAGLRAGGRPGGDGIAAG